MPTARGQGIGRALIDHALAALRASGVKYLEIGTGGDESHAAARGLYEAYGMHPIPVTVYLGRI